MSSGAPGQTFGALRSQVDAYMIGTIPGRPEDSWMTVHNLQCCEDCGKLLVRGVGRGGSWHRRCWARHVSSRRVAISARMGAASQASAVDFVDHTDLPSLLEISSAEIITREFLETALLAIAAPYS